ncbi:monosaccharide ABC transporter membrane protein (CUT2 family) [Rhodobacter aestuarii]|uniref:Xylose transport system permease protein XylH n=1 Tax=Rhodobacter aestuarii TaxID=453582 RepID=A0A1N7QHI4_9RHOB|nr:ABC transporter permease [Rhodobacter aestuarii]PTV93360.1 monosaccharide ABC transporter membrane protein (CUT2 family) [Rhodobacter aestuarii]SIT22246.1 monosaccharide ABC transporter membrane protein, CUT2 family [Rhodobacter aestuarii]
MSMQSAAEAKGFSLGSLIRRPETGSFLGFVVVYTFFAILGGAVFMGAPGWSSWLNIAAEVGIIALPVGLLMISGEFDMSVGAVVPAASVTAALLSGHFELPALIGICGGLAVGLLVGFVNGLLVTRSAIPSLIVTIGVMFAVMGLTLGFAVLIKGSTSLSYVPDPLTKSLLGTFVGGMFNVSIFWWLGFVVAFVFFLHFSPIGNWVFAMGGDAESARNAGVPTAKLKIALFMASGFCAAFVGVAQLMTYQSAQVAGGQSFIFNSIMCVVIGGVLLTGGAGSIFGIVLGTMTFAVVNQGIFFAALDPNIGSIIIGALLLIAVLSNDSFRTLAMTLSSKKK